MNLFFKSCLMAIMLWVSCEQFAAMTPPPAKNPPAGYNYDTEFGPLTSNYSMGDFVRYTANNINVYHKCTQIPYAQDIVKYGLSRSNPHDVDHLYNFIGYLYAGYAALNIHPSTVTTVNWLTKFRQSGQGQSGSLGLFDNNQVCGATVQLVDYHDSYPTAYEQLCFKGDFGFTPTASLVDAWYGFGNMVPRMFFQGQTEFSQASESCAWSTNEQSGQLVLGMPADKIGPNKKPKIPKNNAPWCASPYGQFFGSRISHILGSVCNDIPVITNSSAGTSTLTTTSSSVSLLMPTGTYKPCMAIMNGYVGTSTGLTTSSTAHFGSLKNFLSSIIIPPRLKSFASYLQGHIVPTLTRLADVCSYGLSADNLIKIKDDTITAYDNGVIVALENNTGDLLEIYQTSGTSNNQIGSLKNGIHNYFLHTASLMTGATPVVGNMIELYDAKADCSSYVQVATGVQLQSIVQNWNSAVNNSSSSAAQSGLNAYQMAYNQGGVYTKPSDAAYLVVTNFNPNTLSSVAVDSDELLMYRIQAINLAEFALQPYFVTLQINKEKIGYGLQNSQLSAGAEGTAILYPSIVSIKTCLWQNPLAKKLNAGLSSVQYYSSMPLLLMPENILNANIAGLQSHYGIWLMAYAAALTEFSFNGTFGDNLKTLDTTFELFDVVKQQPPARVVIDASGVLGSGQYVMLDAPSEGLQATATYGALMGCDVWDIGNNFHQDIPVLNLYQDAQSDVVLNQNAGDYVNFYVSVNQAMDKESEEEITTFAQGYGAPYHHKMLYSLPADVMQRGVVGKLSQSKPGKYELMFTDNAGNVLAVQKVVVADKNLTMNIGFLNDHNEAWSQMVALPSDVALVSVGGVKQFTLIFKPSAKSNSLQIKPVTVVTKTQNVVNKKKKKVL